jgi:hypothetical protein
MVLDLLPRNRNKQLFLVFVIGIKSAARVSVVQSVFDLGAIRRLQAGSRGVAQAEDQQRLALQQVTAITILSYLTVLKSEQNLSAARANSQLADRLLELAKSQKDSAVATGLDVARAETRAAQLRWCLFLFKPFSATRLFLRVLHRRQGDWGQWSQCRSLAS